jgi:hypothetical protein
LAWARFVNTSEPILEIAFKRSILEEAPQFMDDVLASATEPDPSRMYFNATISRERAGSPNKGDDHYLVNELSGSHLQAGGWFHSSRCRILRVSGCRSAGPGQVQAADIPAVPPVHSPRG